MSTRTALAGHVAGQLPWGPLLAGYCTGIGVTMALRIFAGGVETPADLVVGLRGSFVPVTAGLAFLLHDPYRQLTAALPARSWYLPALRIAMVLPVLALSAAIQLRIAATALAADLHVGGQPASGLPWVAFTAELAAWCALTLALSAGLERTRWHDVAGFAAAVGGLVIVAALALLPLHALPITFTGMSSAQQRQWAQAWQLWAVTAVAALLIARVAAGEPWRRVFAPLRRTLAGL